VAVGISRALAAYHLDRLADEGLLSVRYERTGTRRGPGAGRPSKLYERSPRQFEVQLPPRDYELAARIFADALDDSSGDPRGAVLDAARRFGSHATQSTGSANHNEAPDPHRVELPDIMRELGYEPIEVNDEIRLRNCPFHALTAEHRDLVCQMNLALVEGVADGCDGHYDAALDPRPGECCVAIHRRPT
jgi:predicted ArsR family transcriptional regulator